jgi:hypothetical protein
MNYRPWPIRILAIIHLAAPLGNLLMSSWLSHVTVGQYLASFNSGWDVFSFFVLLPLAGLSIWLCRWWSLSVFVAAMGWSFWTNFRAYELRPDLFPIWGMILLYGLNLGVVLYFFIPSVRFVYLNQRVRWWEAKPRYFVPIPESRGKIENLSIRGAMIQSTVKMANGDVVPVEFEHAGFKVKAKGEIVRAGAGLNPGTYEYGVQFVSLDSESRRAMRHLIHHLEKSGVTRRPERIRTFQDFFKWLGEVFKTGRGLVPEIPDQFKSQKKK